MSMPTKKRGDMISSILLAALVLAALLFLLSGSAYFISEMHRDVDSPRMASGAGAVCFYYGRGGLQCWPEFEADEEEAIAQGLQLDQLASPASQRLRL